MSSMKEPVKKVRKQEDIQIVPFKKVKGTGKTISAQEAKQRNKQRNKQVSEIKIKEPEVEEVPRCEEPKLPDIEIEQEIKPEVKYEKYVVHPNRKIGRPNKEKTLCTGKEYYSNKREDVLKQKKEYYNENKEKRKEYQSQWYAKKKQEEYKKAHNGSLDGFTIREYNKSQKISESIQK